MDITKIVLIYVCIAIACIFWRPDIVLGTSPQASNILSVLNINSTNYNTLTAINSSVNTDSIFAQGQETRTQNIFLTIIDGLFNVMGYITILFRVVFSPVMVMTAGGFPIEFTYMFGIPLVMMFIIAFVRFVRGY
jgi:hypothetical protein